ncbi:dipeptidase [Alphaproteobacteria bacterium]|jgi:acetylornithine deacetylase/succinyl-diaminopimelate desuccinylase-like protein|nr:dipeptidase [Alphaproteobacteria bacterium]
MTDWQFYLTENRSRFIDELCDFIRIPSVSADPAHAGDVARAGEWVAMRLRAAGAQNVAVLPTAGHPCVYGDWLHAGDEQPTVLIYGHFDVQPALPYDLWTTPPFEPDIRDDSIFARGASDDKGGMLIPILAFEALMKTKGNAPVNVKFIFEGQEEIGSPDMPEFVAKHADLLSADMIFSADGLQWTADEPNIVVGLKGLSSMEITVEGARSDLHSGLHGGAVANPLLALAQILAGLKDSAGNILVDGFYEGVHELSDAERDEIARVPYDEEAYLAEVGVEALHGEPGYTPRERAWARPTLDVNGIWGGYQGAGTKTVLPREASAKITCRLVGDQDPQRVFEAISAHAEKICPEGVRVSLGRLAGSGTPFVMPRNHNASEIARQVLEEIYDMPPYVTRLGGSIPVMSTFLKELGVHTTMFGFSIGDENLHAPDEFFRLRNFDRGQTAYCRLLERLAT